MEKIYLFNYNNYVNRTIKGHGTIADYLADSNADLIATTGIVNFNKKSEEEASIVITLQEGEQPDYLIVVNEDTNIITSRWFVLKNPRGNYNSYTLELKRDLVYDYINSIVNNPDTLIKKGLPKVNDLTILNKEDFSFNAYKRKEVKISLNNSDNHAWVALFVSNGIKSKFDTVSTGLLGEAEIFISQKSNSPTDIYFTSNDDIALNGERGYSIMLLPYEIFLKKYKNYKIGVTGITSVRIDGTVTAIQDKLTCGQINRAVVQSLLPNTSIVDIQIIPDYLSGFDYEIDDDNDIININNDVSSFNYASSMFKIDDKASIFYCCNNPIVSTMRPVNLSDIASGITFEDNFMSIKQLERIKCYLQSPDRSTSKEIDLRYFYKGATKVQSTDVFYFNIECLFQPFQSFVHISPRGLNSALAENNTFFGYNTNDGQYLICGYNNQLLRTTDAWMNFLLSNKNYLNTFNLEIRDSYFNAGTGAITGAIGGATAGAMAGSVIPVLGTAVGAVAGAVIGGGASLVQGLVNTEEKRKQFGWSCDNIKSQPQSVSKVASFVNTNCIYPVLVVCYNEEDGYNDYIKLNGCIINKIDKIKNRYSYSTLPNYNYIVAEIIKFKDFKGTADELLEIQNELERGLYFEVDM